MDSDHSCEGEDTSSTVKSSSSVRAYEALRLAVFPWMRERRKMRRSARARTLSKMIAMGGLINIFPHNNYSLAVRRDGSVACWGSNNHGKAPPGGVDGDFVAVSAGWSHSLALRRDGTIACWGDNTSGQAPPEGVDGDFVAVAAGEYHSLALRRDGTIACWGFEDDDDDDDYGYYDDYYNQAPPDGVEGEFVAIDVGAFHSLALRRDGSVACWGSNGHGEAPPDGVTGDFIAIAAGRFHSLALRRDGSIACWGCNSDGNRNIFAPPDGVEGEFVAIAAGRRHSLALRRDGSIACWNVEGMDGLGLPQSPGHEIVEGGFVAIATNEYQSLAMRRDGTIACWGGLYGGEVVLPEGVAGTFGRVDV